MMPPWADWFQALRPQKRPRTSEARQLVRSAVGLAQPQGDTRRAFPLLGDVL
jgi:hypothetical protein